MTAPAPATSGSASIEQPGYWWYRARAELLRAALGPHLGEPRRVLDVGSADGPSVGWMAGSELVATVDLDPRGLTAGTGVQASALALPFADGSFDVVGAFDVVEHCEPESVAVGELARVLAPGGRLLLSVPAYAWAWSDHDVRAGHHRRYTRARIERAVRAAGLEVLRSTHGFAAVFPLFAAERLSRRIRRPSGDADRLPRTSARTDRALMGLCGVEARVLRRRDLPFGSSVFVAARKP
ncbi:class I SAM-dependent methyltransferase [Nocardioides sp. MAHUQ-72]|uniref:class I SAM-dependent methyltransferase n=1 Tax=unclassified Nocardioides TaxID=2615069 RepID=UPI00360FF585